MTRACPLNAPACRFEREFARAVRQSWKHFGPDDLGKMEIGMFVRKGALARNRLHIVHRGRPLCGSCVPGHYKMVVPRVVLPKVECQLCREAFALIIRRANRGAGN